MAEQTLTTFYKGWDRYQRSLIAAIAKLSREELALSLPPHWPVGRIAAHIVAARVWWLHSRAGEGSVELAPMESWDRKGEPLRESSELVCGLELTWQMIADVLERWSVADLLYVFPACPDDPTKRTRQWIIWHLIEHDISHGSEISLVLGAHGLDPVDVE